uniref:Uncharacterized protein n=1 Tax=Anopheles dirus TaxID=7168 RepID=A0A182N7Y6_9DIPT
MARTTGFTKAYPRDHQLGNGCRFNVGEHVKEAVQNVTHELENVLGGRKDKSDHVNEDDQPTANGHGDADNADYQIIRLKGSKQNSVEETEKMENMKNDLLTKAQSFGDDTDRMADDLMKETEDLLRDAETGIAHDEMTTRITSSEDGTIEILNLEGNAPSTPNHSIDSLKTTSPEPEIERILAGGEEGSAPPDSPKATLNTLSVPASTREEGMAMEATAQSATTDKPDVYVDPGSSSTPQVSIDGESMTSSEEFFRTEVLKATSTHTPGRTVNRRPNAVPRAPPPSMAAAGRVQRFIFKLNSIILSDIEERVDDEGSIVRQLERNPDRVVELLSNLSMDSAEDCDETPVPRKARRKVPTGIRRQQSVALEEGPDVDKTEPSVQRDPTDEDQPVLLRDIPPAVRLRALMRFKSLDGFGQDMPVKPANGRRRMKSLDTVDASTDNDTEEQNHNDGDEDENTLTNVSYDPAEEERICEELLEELRTLERADRVDAADGSDPAGNDDGHEDASTTLDAGADDDHKTAWEKLQDYMQRVPKRRASNYDLFYDSDEDTLKTLFKRHKLKLMFHYSDSSSGSSDTL